jgi:hypothetical protein
MTTGASPSPSATAPGIVIDLANSKYDKVVLTVENPQAIAARLSVPPS